VPKKFRRDLATLEAYELVNHNETCAVDYTTETAETTIFSANTSCILTPEVTDGPYYVTGESIRSNVKEDLYSDGVDLYLEVQYLDITTCEPVEGIYVDIWNANATGVYRYGQYSNDENCSRTNQNIVVSQKVATTPLMDGTPLTSEVSRRLTPTELLPSRLFSQVTTKAALPTLICSHT
jgi:protocatechuate 3,4-dioxygenase beta subunit